MLVLAALVVMSTPWFEHILERQVIAGLEDVTGGRAEIGYFHFNPWLFHIRLTDLVIHGSEPAGALPILVARDLEAGISPGRLLRRRLRLRHLDIVELQLRLRTNSQGITNLPLSAKRTSAQLGFRSLMDLSIGRLTISHSAVYWNDQQEPVEVQSRELALLFHLAGGRYSGALSSSATTIGIPGWISPPITFNGRFELSAANFVFSSFAWQAAGTFGEAAFTMLPRSTVEGSGSFHASIEAALAGRIFAAPELRSGALQIEGQAVYQGGTISAQGRAQARQVEMSAPALLSVRLDATTSYDLEDHRLNLSNLLISIWGGTVQGTFQADFAGSSSKFHLHSRLYEVRLANMLASTNAPPLLAAQTHLASMVNGGLSASWSGRWEDLRANFDISLQALTGPPHSLPVSGSARGTLEDSHGMTLRLSSAVFRTPHSAIAAHGTLRQVGTNTAQPEPLDVTASTDDFEEWRPLAQSLVAAPASIPLELNSSAEFSGQLMGSSQQPSVQGHIKMGPFRYQNWLWDRLAADVQLNPNFILLSGGRVDRGKSACELNGSAELENWKLAPASHIRFIARAQRTPLEGLVALINSDLPVRGSATALLDISGTATSLAGSGTIRVDGGAYADEPFDSASARLRVSKSVWNLQDILLTKNTGRLNGQITIEPERRFASGQLRGTDFRLADFHRLASAIGLPKGGWDGSFSFDAAGHGTVKDFHLQGSWGLINWNLGGTPLGELRGTLKGEGNQVTLEGEDQSPNGTLHFRARALAQDGWPLEATAEYSKLRVDPWIRAMFNREFGAAVTLGGILEAQGTLRTPENISFQSHVQDLAVDFPSIQWHNAQPVNVSYSDGRLALSRFVMRGPSTELAMEGKVQIVGGVSLAINAAGAVDATLLTLFDPGLQASGRSTLQMRLTGSPDRPQMSGALEIQDMSLGYKELPFRFSNLQGTVKLDGERAVINSLRGSSGGGTVTLAGLVTLADAPRFDVRADLNQVRMRYPPNFTSVFDGQLRLAGGVAQAQLTGEIVVHQMVINERVNFISKIMESSNPIPEQPVSINSPIASKIRLNVRVTSSPPVQLQTPSLRLSGDIDLRLQGTLADPVQLGSIHFLSGESVFRGNRYTLVRGDLSMNNPLRTQAYLDIEAQTRVQSYDVTLDISGPFDRLKFSYRSDPPLANTDILSLLALGYVKEEQAFSTTAGNPAASVGASAILSEALSSQTTSRIQRLFGVSRIKIDPNVGIPGFGSGALVTVEQQVTHDLTLTYVTDTSYSQYRIIQFEWNISDKVSVLGIRDQNGVFGVEFRFRQRFK